MVAYMKKYSKLYHTIDCHTHCGIDYSNLYLCRYPTTQSVTTLAEQMQSNQIGYAITFPCPNTIYYHTEKYWKDGQFVYSGQSDFPFQWENRYLQAEIEHFGYDHILPFAAVSLRRNLSSQLAYLEELVETKPLYGIKLHTLADNSDILELSHHEKFLKFLKKYDLPIMCHTGTDPYSLPMKIVEFARHFPEIRICAAHMAKFDIDAFEALSTEPLENLFVDTSPLNSLCQRYKMDSQFILAMGLTGNCMLEDSIALIRRFQQHILWGTDNPWVYVSKLTQNRCETRTTYQDEVQFLHSLASDLQETISIQNPNRFLFGSIR